MRFGAMLTVTTIDGCLIETERLRPFMVVGMKFILSLLLLFNFNSASESLPDE